MRFIFLNLLVFLSSCFDTPRYIPQSEETDRIANEIMRKVGTKIKKETGLLPCGTGGSTMHGVKMLALSFDCAGELTIEEGRKLLIQAVDEFVKEVNDDERIYPYLVDKPFGPKNIQIRIFLYGPGGIKIQPGKLSVITAISGEFVYKIDDPDSNQFKTILKETYEEALTNLKSGDIAQIIPLVIQEPGLPASDSH